MTLQKSSDPRVRTPPYSQAPEPGLQGQVAQGGRVLLLATGLSWIAAAAVAVLLPIVFAAFPSGWNTGVSLNAMAAGFPVAVLTWPGVARAPAGHFGVARTLGASPFFLLRHVAVPAALPHVFTGLFMGLAAPFSMLAAAEFVGVKAGLGFYLQWAQGWASYGSIYAALIVLSLACSTAVTFLFIARDRLLPWQKGLVKW